MPRDNKYAERCDRVVKLLREERERRNLTTTQVAAAAGLSQQMVSYVERGMRRPTLDTLLRISDAIGVDLGEIIKRSEG